MIFVRTDDLKPGMRVAKPIYNKLGVLLYDRESPLTEQGVESVKNFGLIGLYILEPAEPAPPITDEEIEFERFQTIYMFRIKDIMDAVLGGKQPESLTLLVDTILKRYGSLDHKFAFNQNLRTPEDYHYKHSLNVAILCAMITSKLELGMEARRAVVAGAILHDVGMLSVPKAVMEKDEADFDENDLKTIANCLHTGYQLLQPSTNAFDLPDITLRMLQQTSRFYYSPRFPVDENVKWSLNSRILQVANAFDNLTAMSLQHEPVSAIASFRYLAEYPDYFEPRVVMALTECIRIIPEGCCVELSNGEKGMVIKANPANFMAPVVLQFKDNRLLDLSNPIIASTHQIVDVMRTMDNRIEVDESTLEQFVADEHLTNQLNRLKGKLEG
ncbi:MAG: HD domain-containing protein [Lachnospiraceae bacterium]|nr:HD domain-containing protein [Lachnospiraceae bacterium]MBQ9341823.1 HD domain-containing protein [Lachnospiraceae bacterium]